jgi:hypothetical protein
MALLTEVVSIILHGCANEIKLKIRNAKRKVNLKFIGLSIYVA